MTPNSQQRPSTKRLTPCLIVFAREPIIGTTKTRLARQIGARNAVALAGAFNCDALAKVYQLGWPMVLAGSATTPVQGNHYFNTLAQRFSATLVDQGRGHLGERMARVMAPFASAGAILIGTDTPSLPASAIRRAVSLLRRNHVVLGPTLDGGYYLVGVRGSLPDMFRGIRWGGPRVLRETVARLTRLGIQPAYAPTWYDVDRLDDLRLLVGHLRHQRKLDALCPGTVEVLMRLGLLPRVPLHYPKGHPNESGGT
jgi:rSAM/selenodomain-associated transferase 1